MLVALQKPHLIVDAAPWFDNYYHFYNDLLQPAFQTLIEQGLANETDWDSRAADPEYPEEALVGFIALTKWPLDNYWLHLLPYLSTDWKGLAAAGALCYETLVVEQSQRLNWYWWRTPGSDADQRAEAHMRFRHWHEQVRAPPLRAFCAFLVCRQCTCSPQRSAVVLCYRSCW